MVRVSEQTVFVDHQAARRLAWRVGVAIFANRLIRRDESLDSLLDRVRLTERADDAGLFPRILLLGGCGSNNADLPG